LYAIAAQKKPLSLCAVTCNASFDLSWNSAMDNADSAELLALQRIDETCMQLQQQGSYLEALECMERGLVLRQHFFGSDSEEVSAMCYVVAILLFYLQCSGSESFQTRHKTDSAKQFGTSRSLSSASIAQALLQSILRLRQHLYQWCWYCASPHAKTKAVRHHVQDRCALGIFCLVSLLMLMLARYLMLIRCGEHARQ
jgi:hypothetical protein